MRMRPNCKSGGKALKPERQSLRRQAHQPFLVRDNQTVVDMLQRWAVQMDLPVEQVELAAQIVTISEKACVNWGEMEPR